MLGLPDASAWSSRSKTRFTTPMIAAISPPGRTCKYMWASSVGFCDSIWTGFCGLMNRISPTSFTGLNTMILQPRFTAS